MLQDSFIETSVKRKNGLTEVIFNSVLITAGIIAIGFAFYIPFLISSILSFRRYFIWYCCIDRLTY